MTKEYLEARGWKRVYTQWGCQLWEHPDHQYRSRGFFTRTAASEHQRFLDRGNTCSCVKHDGGDRKSIKMREELAKYV